MPANKLDKDVGSVKYETNGRVEDLLEGLAQKVERLSLEKDNEYEESRRAMASLDKLLETMKRLENQKKRQSIVARRVSHLQDRLERTTGAYRGDPVQRRSLTDSVYKVLSGAKATGQVIEIVAGSLQVMMETVKTVIKNQSSGTRSYGAAAESRGTDLAALLKPLNTILSSLLTKPQTATAQEPGKVPEAAEGQQQKKDQPDPVPVVRAVPVQEQQTAEKM